MSPIRFRSRRFAVLAAAVTLTSGAAFASTGSLQDVVYKVETQYHDVTREQLLGWAEVMRRIGSPELEKYFRSIADRGAGGTGWLFTDATGRYVITNAHVVRGASKVTLSRERRNAPGRMESLGECEILYVDSESDLAVISVPDSADVPATGLQLGTHAPHNLQPVVAAGFPGHLGPQTWNITRGEVSNSSAPGIPFRQLGVTLDSLIEHTAMIDHGNSGGPLLVPRRPGPLDDRDARKFVVVGVNTFNVGRAFFSIPAAHVRRVLDRARSVRRTMQTSEGRERALWTQAKVLEGELSKVRTDREDLIAGLAGLHRFMSQAYVARHGNQTFVEQFLRKTTAEREEMLRELFNDPIGALRWYALVDFVRTLASVGDLSTTHFREINFADRQDILHRPDITTSFDLGSRKQDIVWTVEAGEWRIAELRFAPAAKAAAGTARDLAPAGQGDDSDERNRDENPSSRSSQPSLIDRIRGG
jgi:serine protease Do